MIAALALFASTALLPASAMTSPAQEQIRIRADKLVYLERGTLAEFKNNVVFERDDFKGRSRSLQLNRKTNSIFASGAVSAEIFNQGRGDMSFTTEKLFYEDSSSEVFSPDKATFVVDVSTSVVPDIYIINCSSFSGNIADKQFHLTGKPVTIEGEKLSGFSDTLDCSPSLTEMRGNAHVDYFEWKADASYIKMDFEKEEYEFKDDVKGVFYPHNAENR